MNIDKLELDCHKVSFEKQLKKLNCENFVQLSRRANSQTKSFSNTNQLIWRNLLFKKEYKHLFSF